MRVFAYCLQTFLPNPSDHSIRLKVLYDDVLDMELSVNRRTVGIPGDGRVTFRDLHDRPLQLPTLVFPFRRVFVWHAKSAFANALKSATPHTIAESCSLSEEEWNVLVNYCKGESPECSQSTFFND